MRMPWVTDGVELTQVTKTYGPVRALVGVSCRFLAGKVTAVLGPNGSGKSTLLAIAGTLARPTSGTVTYGNFGRTREQVRSVLGWLGHESLCYPDLTGRENIELAATLRNRPSGAAFARMAERFELGAFAERPFRTYSRGQRQRIALARALVHEPLLVLLDEPTTGLDESSTRMLASVMTEEAGRGAAVVLVTHDRAFADAIAGEVVVLERGRLA